MPNISREQKERIENTKYQRRHVGLLFILNRYFFTSEATTTCWLSLYNKSLFKPQKQRRHVAFSLYYPSVCTSEETTTFWPSRYITVISLFLPKKQRRHFGLLFILISLFVPQKQRRYFGFISILIFLFVPQKQRQHFAFSLY